MKNNNKKKKKKKGKKNEDKEQEYDEVEASAMVERQKKTTLSCRMSHDQDTLISTIILSQPACTICTLCNHNIAQWCHILYDYNSCHSLTVESCCAASSDTEHDGTSPYLTQY